MSIVGGNPQFFGPPVQQNGIAVGTLNQLFSQGVAPGQAPVALSPADLQRLIGTLFQALQQLGTGWAGFAGGAQQQQQNQQLAILQSQAQQSAGLADQARQMALGGFAQSMGVGIGIPGATSFSPFGNLQPNLFQGPIAGPTSFAPFGTLQPNLFQGPVAGPTDFAPFGTLQPNLFQGPVAGPTGFEPFGTIQPNLFLGQVPGPTSFAPFGNIQPNIFPGSFGSTNFGETEQPFPFLGNFPQFGGGSPTPGFPGGYNPPPSYGPPQGYAPPQGYGNPGGPWGFRPGMTPVGPAPTPSTTNPVGPVLTTPEINTNINFKTLTDDQRTNLSGLDDHDRAVLHLWGKQMTSAGRQDGGIAFNVANNPNDFNQAERDVTAAFTAKDKALYGGVNGKSLDEEFFKVFKKITGEDISGQYGNSPAHFATGPVNLENRVSGNNGMSAFENGIIRLWGHEPLFNGGKIDGSILSYTLNSPNALDFGLNKQDVQTLLTADLSADGKRDGDSLKFGFGKLLDKLYMGGQGVSADDVTQHAQAVAAQTRPFGAIPPGGNLQQFQQYAQALGPDLAKFNGDLNEISALSGTVPQNANLDGRFENGLFMRTPTDQREFASYLQAQVAGGALNGQTTIRQADALTGTRFGQVADPTQWNASVARTYAYQFAAEAAEYSGKAPQGTYNPLTADGVANGAKYFETMAPDARIFTQVASVFKGNLMGGPGNYNNPALKQLLEQKAQQTGDPELTRLASQANVGQTDVQTIGAITNALNSGKITLNDIMASGAISQQDMPRYTNIIGYVQNGQFNQDLGHFDANPIRDGNGNAIANTGTAGSSQNTGASPNASQGGVGGVNGLYNSFNGPNPHQGRLDELKADPVVKGFYAMLDLNGDGKVNGPETAAATSNLNDLINLMMSGAQPGPNAPAAVQQFFRAHDFDKDGRYSVDEVRQAMKDLSPVLESIKLDQYSNGANAGKPVAYGPPPGINPNGNIANCPVLGKMVNKQ